MDCSTLQEFCLLSSTHNCHGMISKTFAEKLGGLVTKDDCCCTCKRYLGEVNTKLLCGET